LALDWKGGAALMVHVTCSIGWFGAVLDPLQFASFVRWKHTQPIPHGPECGRSSVQMY
jgi:hypothetical protein